MVLSREGWLPCTTDCEEDSFPDSENARLALLGEWRRVGVVSRALSASSQAWFSCVECRSRSCLIPEASRLVTSLAAGVISDAGSMFCVALFSFSAILAEILRLGCHRGLKIGAADLLLSSPFPLLRSAVRFSSRLGFGCYGYPATQSARSKKQDGGDRGGSCKYSLSIPQVKSAMAAPG